MTRIALIGASGNVGQRLLKELSDRGHQITAIARGPDMIADLPGVTSVKGDIKDSAGLAALIEGHDAVVSSVRFLDTDFETLLGAVRKSGVKRYLVVGGAGSLETAPGVTLLDNPDFPDAYRAEATAGAGYLKLLRQVTDIEWTFLSPSAMFVPGERTGVFRLGKDQLLTNESGSSISFEDFAIAMADEIETPRHIRKRFTVGY